MRAALAAAAAALALLPAAPAAAEAPCVRTPGSVYWQACVNERDCLLYLWASKPPALCLSEQS